MKALVTGGAGFIGSHITDALLARGWHVRVLDNLEPRVHPAGRPAYLNRAAEFFEGDVRNRGTLERALAGVEVVYHQAAHQDYMPEYSKFFHTNVVSTALLFEVIREKNLDIRKFIVASSQSVYGEGQYRCFNDGLVLPEGRSVEQLDRAAWNLRCLACGGELDPLPLCEEHPNPAGPYGVSKFAQEIAALRLGKILGIPTVALRYSIVQGARQSFYNAYSGICRIFTRALKSGKAPIIFEDGKQLRDYIHVEDVVAANLRVLDDPRADGEAFNVGTGHATTVLKYAELLIESMKTHILPEISGIYRLGDVRHTVSSVAKLEKLGWKATKGLPEIFTDYLTWLGETPDAADYFTPAYQAMRSSGIVRNTNKSHVVSAV